MLHSASLSRVVIHLTVELLNAGVECRLAHSTRFLATKVLHKPASNRKNGRHGTLLCIRLSVGCLNVRDVDPFRWTSLSVPARMSCTCGTASSSSRGKHERRPLPSHAQYLLLHHIVSRQAFAVLHLYFVVVGSCLFVIVALLLSVFASEQSPARHLRAYHFSPADVDTRQAPFTSCVSYSCMRRQPRLLPQYLTATACGSFNPVPSSRTCFVSPRAPSFPGPTLYARPTPREGQE